MIGHVNYSSDIDEKNLFEFIERKLSWGLVDDNVYLTPQGDFIINGEPYGRDWKDWVIKSGKDFQYGIEDINSDIPKRKIEIIERDYQIDKMKWMKDAGVDYADLITLKLLHEQYEAIRKYSIDPTNEEAIQTIFITYKLTGINCLRYLSELRTPSEWIDMIDAQGMFLGVVFSGEIPSEIENEKLVKYLEEMHKKLNYYIEEIYEIASSYAITPNDKVKRLRRGNAFKEY